MGYKYEVFVSYKWGSDVKLWVDEVFVPILKHALYEIIEDPSEEDVFHDARENLPGGSIPAVLRDGVANSKCMVCVITKSYFTRSTWCTAELSAMLQREDETLIRTNGNHFGLVFPVMFVDNTKQKLVERNLVYSLDAPKNMLSNIQPLELDEKQFFRMTAGFKGSSGYDDLRLIITDWVRNSLLSSISNPPQWKEDWHNENYFVSRFAPPLNSRPVFTLPRL